MNLQKLNPWNWFKHEESASGSQQIPVKNNTGQNQLATNQQYSSYPRVQFHQEIDRMFDDFFRGSGLSTAISSLPANNLIRPNLNISSDDKNYKISLELPGLKESDISIEVKNDVLTIQGEINEQKEDKDRDFYRVERSYGSFQRVLALPEDASADDIQAEMKDGILNLTIPHRVKDDSNIRKTPVNYAS